MAEATAKLGLTKPTEDEYFDVVGDFNANWDKLDELTHIVASGSTDVKFLEPGSTSTKAGDAKWRYKKFNDGTFEMYGKLTVNNLTCNEVTTAGQYRSKSIRVFFPAIGQTEIYHRSISIRDGNTDSTAVFNALVDTTANSEELTFASVRAYCNAKETKNRAKDISIEVKGLWA